MKYFNITHYLEATVQNWPDRTAVIEGEHSITVSEVRIKSLYIAKKISIAVQGNKNSIVAVYLPKSINSVIANIGIVYSGNAYMNLDIKNPQERIRNITNLIKPSLIVTTSQWAKSLDQPVPLLLLDKVFANEQELGRLSFLEEQAVLHLRDSIIDTDPLCIINTSGSTGTPKGVVLNHRSFIDFTERVIERGLIRDNEVVASLSPLVFDIYSFELCMFMAKGSTLVLVPDSLAAFPVRILELLAKHKVTYIFWVPTIMVNIANMDLLSKFTLPHLAMVWFAGEVFPTAKFNYWRSNIPQATFANFYGPIEITLDCTYYIIDRQLADDEPIPIGRPFANTGVLILDENDRASVAGEDGELCIRGTSLAMGYYNNPEKTAAAFVQNPLNTSYPEIIYRTGDIVYMNAFGEIVYKGRKDTMIKHLGYRIELGEIEHVVISSMESIKNCCAIYKKEKKQIVLFFESTECLDEKELRIRLLEVLPKYMLPSLYLPVIELPRNANGKIDRLQLNKMSLE